MRGNMWTRDNIKQLIKYWKKNSVLYDCSHKLYFNRKERSRIFEKILANLKKDMPSLTINDIRKKMRYLRKQYLIRYYKIKRSIRTSGKLCEPTLWFFWDLSFLEQHLQIETAAIKDNLVDKSAKVSSEEVISNDKKKLLDWTRENVLKLITLWEMNPALYDSNHKYYNNVAKCGEIMQQITEELQYFMPIITEKEVTRKISILKSKFIRQYSLVEKYKDMSDTVYKPKLFYYDKLLFLEKHLEVEQPTPNNNEVTEFVDVNANFKDNHSYLLPTFGRKQDQTDATDNLPTQVRNLKKNVTLKSHNRLNWVGGEVSYYMKKIKNTTICEEASTQIMLILKNSLIQDNKLKNEKSATKDSKVDDLEDDYIDMFI
ncbi:uncharacterized protein LOC119673213 [Teleopsis dalmanni]|uniref:uncharacterized protein LOC119673213 n=1 Tax=Teleopsis dalmanni TaxID=139649 RepID=UPI0018CF0A4B|nr:uncharacterized protein LOC119673213 [Teleopsis dalmanni]